MTLTKASSVITLHHLKHFINDQKELVNYLNSLRTEQEWQIAIRQFQDQIMQLYVNVKNLMYSFVKFLDNNSLYSRMTSKKEEWKMMNIEHERIEKERRDIAEIKRIMMNRWNSKLLNLWISKKDSSLYSVKREAMNKMRAIIARIQNEHLIKVMMKQIIYHKAMQTIVSRDRVLIFSFSQFTDFDKLIVNQIEVMLMNEKLDHMNWRRVKSDLLCECISDMILKTDHVETVFSSSAVSQFDFERRSRSSILSLQSRRSSIVSKNEDSHFMLIASNVVMISNLNSSMSAMQSLMIRFHQLSRVVTSISSDIITSFTSLNSSRTSRVHFLMSSHFLISIALTFSKLAEYDEQRLALSLDVIMNNEKILLQYSLETEMSDTASVCKKAIIVTAIKSVRSKVQQSRYQIIKNIWKMRESRACSCIWVSHTWKQRLDYLDLISSIATMKLLREYRFKTKNEEMFMCHSHLQRLKNRLKLLTNKLSFEILIDHINIIYDYRFRLDFVKIDVTFADWFRQDSRFFHFTDSLQLFRLWLHMSQNYKIDTFLIYNMFIEKIKYQKWKKNDAIMLSNVFNWILNDNTWVLIREKLNMYLWHQRNDLDLTNHDWLRTTVYIMLQQLVRQNIVYYLITVTLRLNHEIDLLTFSYFMKITFKNVSKLIKHVNLNVNDLMSDREQSRIQSTAMFADESIDKDDEFILDLHLCMKKWWKEAIKRNLVTNEYTHCVVLEMFNENDSRRSDLK